ncbi:serine hydrolase domain-containing protein [Paenibacillus sp. GCM10027626]|uniref:serine hydrolase domain-containing protein n=1 Tax=Paenibacillus sp. GCM10027626 TaxID=3273411 RepID=UPI00364040AA
MKKKRRQRFIIQWLVLLSIIVGCLGSGKTAGAQAAAAAALDEQMIDETVEKSMQQYNIPGLALGIIKGDRIVYLKGYGVADKSGRKVTPQTPFIIGSLSKSFTALAMMQLVEQGKIQLDDPVQHYLPWFSEAAITVRQLLHQTSGFSTAEGRSFLQPGWESLDEMLEKHHWRTVSDPGTAFHYSNANYLLLGRIVEVVSKQSYEQYVQENILLPLQMNNSFTDHAQAVGAGLAAGYQPVFGKLRETHPAYLHTNLSAGYLMASAEDMAHYAIAQTNEGKYQERELLSAQGMRTMHTGIDVTSYGMGWFTGQSTISHTGDTENFHADLYLSTASGWGVILLMNTNDALGTTLLGNHYGDLAFELYYYLNEGIMIDPGQLDDPLAPVMLKVMYGVLIAVCLWICWSLYRLYRMMARGSTGTGRKQMLRDLLFIIIHIGAGTAILLRVPYAAQAPWKVVMSFMPGEGHLLLAVAIALLVLGAGRVIAAGLSMVRHLGENGSSRS